jgi:hypothetical protein
MQKMAENENRWDGLSDPVHLVAHSLILSAVRAELSWARHAGSSFMDTS